MKILIFGNGFLGKRFAESWDDAVLTDARIDDKATIMRVLETEKPDAVVNAAGRNGTPNVDWCETNQVATYESNTVGALLLAAACQATNTHLVQLSSGCIFYGESPEANGWREQDTPNPVAYYSKTKYATDLLLGSLPNVAVARLRLPVDDRVSPKNLIDKLSKYKQVIDVQNSVTVVEDLVSVVRQLIEKRASGIFHCTNPGALRYRDLLALYKEQVDPNHSCEWIGDAELAARGLTAKNRSTCLMQSTRLREYGIIMRPIDEAVRATMQAYAAHRAAETGNSGA